MRYPATIALAMILGLSSAPLAFGADMRHGHGTSQAARAADAMTAGEVRKIDKSTGKITIQHGPLVNLGMPAMTMAFRVADPAMLDRVRPGDKIRFVADQLNGALTVVALESA